MRYNLIKDLRDFRVIVDNYDGNGIVDLKVMIF